MKKLLLIAGVFALILSSCTQDLPVAPENTDQEVIFTSNDLKGFKADLYDCDASAVYAKVYLSVDGTPIDGSPITAPVFYVNDIMYTQAIKLPSGETGITYTLTQFELYDENDELVNAVPVDGSEYGEMVSVTVPLDITVSPFTKSEIPLSILCYSPEDYQAFGFTWFRITEEEITNKFFFGDFCTKFFEDYAADEYYGPETMVDMKAIFELTLWEMEGGDWNEVRTVNNLGDANAGNSGDLLELIYPTDRTNDGDLFRIDIKIRVKVGEDFEFVNFGSWFFADESTTMYTNEGLTDGAFDFGTDGVYDFILGNCNANGADFMFAPYMNLPETLDLTLTYPGTVGYFDGWLDNFNGDDSAGFDFAANSYAGGSGVPEGIFCFDKDHTISVPANGTPKTFSGIDVYSSLYPGSMAGANVITDHLDMLNWLINHLTDYTYNLVDLQEALWEIQKHTSTSPYTAATAKGHQMAQDAITNGSGYVPMPGGWAAVILDVDPSTGTDAQTLFVRVDP